MAAISAYDKINYSQLKLPSFEELAMAPAHLTKKHEEAEENLAAITSEATKAERLAMESPDSEASKMYQGYLQKLQEATDALGQKGVNMSGVKQRVNEARGTYNSTIAPILSAGELRSKYAEAAASAKTSGMEVAPIENSIDAWMGRNGQMPAINGVSHDKIYKQASDIGESLKSQIDQVAPQLQQVTGPNGKPIMDEYIYYVTTGAVPENIMKMMRRELTPEQMSKIDQTINNSVEGLLEANNVYGLFKPGSEEAERLRTTAFLGMNSAVGGTQMGKMTDEATRFNRNQAIQYEYDIKLFKEKQAIENANKMNSAMQGLGNYYPTVDEAAINSEEIKMLEGIEKSLDAPGTTEVFKGTTTGYPGYTGKKEGLSDAQKSFLAKYNVDITSKSKAEILKDIQRIKKYSAQSYASHDFNLDPKATNDTVEAIMERPNGFIDEKGNPISREKLVKDGLISLDESGMNVTGVYGRLKMVPVTGQMYLLKGDGKSRVYINGAAIDSKGLAVAQTAVRASYANVLGIKLDEVTPENITRKMYENTTNIMKTQEAKEAVAAEKLRITQIVVSSGQYLSPIEIEQKAQQNVEERVEQQIQKQIWTTKAPGTDKTIGETTRGSMDTIFTSLTYSNPTN